MTDMVPHEIEPAKGVGGAAHDRAGEIVLAEIADEAECAASGGGDLRDHCIDTCLVDVGNPDRCTFAGEADRARPPIPEAAAVTIPIFRSSRTFPLLRPRFLWSDRAHRALRRTLRGSRGA